MRVYEFAKTKDVSNKDVLDVLTNAGFEVSSHMSALTPEALKALEDHYAPKKKQQAARKEVPAPAASKEKIVAQSHVEPTQSQSVNPAPAAPKIMVSPAPEKLQEPQQREQKATVEKSIEIVAEPMTLGQFAEIAHKPVTEIIMRLLKQGLACAKNQVLSEDVIKDLARVYSMTVVPSARAMVQQHSKVAAVHGEQRLPVVVIIGHVDHGKTTLLDYVRKTRVAAREKGGITQHLGAYRVATSHGDLIFLDTPGHAAFSKMRGRGVRVADIAVLVVAADDGVMPQTIEAVKHAQAVNTPIIVAVNKMDKAEPARVEVIKRELSVYGLMPEEWAGSTLYVPISAKTGQGIDNLLEMIVLQSQMMELKADRSATAAGFVLEAKLEHGRGPVATVITHQGILKVGDFISAGKTYGKISSMIDSYGNSVRTVEPSVPVQVAGFAELPESGDAFEVVTEKQYNKLRGGPAEARSVSKSTVREDTFNIIIKSDTYSSQEALVDAIAKLPTKNAQEINIVHAAVGPVSESDVLLAETTHSVVFMFHVKVDTGAAALAHKHGVEIKRYDVIYHLLEALEERVKKAQKIPMVSKKIGEAVIRKVFDIKNVGVIAGAYVKDGRFSREGKVVAYRGKQKIGEGSIKSLERDRKPVKEVHAGFEFAFLLDGFNEWQVDDRAECFVEVPATTPTERS